jgi:hypothetical protein
MTCPRRAASALVLALSVGHTRLTAVATFPPLDFIREVAIGSAAGLGRVCGAVTARKLRGEALIMDNV